MKLPWSRSRRTARSRFSIIKQRTSRHKAGGGFRYDPLSYAQNFDVGFDEDDEDYTQRGFSARYAAPAAAPLSKSLEDK